MTEADWLASEDPRRMLDFAGRLATPRKLRLFACEECRRVWTQIVKDTFREAVEVAERYAFGAADYEELRLMAHRTSHAVNRRARSFEQSKLQGHIH